MSKIRISGVAVAVLAAALSCLAVPAAGAATPSHRPVVHQAAHRAAPQAALTLTNPGNQSDTVNFPVSLQMHASGGTPPYTWSASVNPNLFGIGISRTTGLITGKPNPVGTYIMTVQVTDSAGHVASVSFNWRITPNS